MFQRALVSLLVLGLTYVAMTAMVTIISKSITHSGDMIAATTGGHPDTKAN